MAEENSKLGIWDADWTHETGSDKNDLRNTNSAPYKKHYTDRNESQQRQSAIGLPEFFFRITHSLLEAEPWTACMQAKTKESRK